MLVLLWPCTALAVASVDLAMRSAFLPFPHCGPNGSVSPARGAATVCWLKIRRRRRRAIALRSGRERLGIASRGRFYIYVFSSMSLLGAGKAWRQKPHRTVGVPFKVKLVTERKL
jgi:hypothetical protein